MQVRYQSALHPEKNDLNGREPLELKLTFFELFDTNSSTLFDDFLERIARMDLSGIDVDGNRSGDDSPSSNPFDFKIREDALFFL